MTHIQGLNVISVHVSDLAKAVAFYHEGLGLGLENMMEDMGWAQVQVPNGPTIGLHVWGEACRGNGGRNPGTVTGGIITVDDPHAFAKVVESSGGSITDPVVKQPWGPVGGTMADPDGNEWMFTEPMPSQ